MGELKIDIQLAVTCPKCKRLTMLTGKCNRRNFMLTESCKCPRPTTGPDNEGSGE